MFNAEPAAWRYLVHGEWFVTNIKGAADFWQSEGCVVEPLYTATAQSDADPKNVREALKELRECLFAILHDGLEAHSEYADSAIIRADAALAQSDAEPVAWRYAYPDYPDHWNVTSDKLTADERRGNAGCIVEPLYAAPPRPDASAGLIEAAEYCEKEMSHWSGDAWSDGVRYGLKIAAKNLRRAADRCGK